MGEKGRNDCIQTSVFQYTTLNFARTAREMPILLLRFVVVHIRIQSLCSSGEQERKDVVL